MLAFLPHASVVISGSINFSFEANFPFELWPKKRENHQSPGAKTPGISVKASSCGKYIYH